MSKLFKISTFVFGIIAEAFILLCAYVGLGAANGCRDNSDDTKILVEMVKRGWNIKE